MSYLGDIRVTDIPMLYHMVMELTGEDIKRIAIEAFEDQRRMLARANEAQEQD